MTVTIATLIPALPVDLVYLVLDYAPGIALAYLSVQEHVEIVRRLTGLTLSDEHASLALEQRDLGNRDFDTLDLVSDKDAWCEALHSAFSPRVFDELVRLGQFAMPLTWIGGIQLFASHSLRQGEDQGLALARHLQHMGPHVDLLYHTGIIDVANFIVHPPTVQYLLERLLDARDPSYDSRRQAQLQSVPAFAQAYTTSPLGLLVYRISCNGVNGYCTQEKGDPAVLFLQTLVSLHPTTWNLLLEFCVINLLHCLFYDYRYVNLIRTVCALAGTSARPPGRLIYGGWNQGDNSFKLTYDSMTCQCRDTRILKMASFCDWLVDDWLIQANEHTRTMQENDAWKGFGSLFRSVSMHRRAATKLVEGAPDSVRVRYFTRHPTLLCTFDMWPSVPGQLTTLVPFSIWLAGLVNMPYKSDRSAFRYFNAQQRVLLRRA
jgi:hypothetical protein